MYLNKTKDLAEGFIMERQKQLQDVKAPSQLSEAVSSV